MHHLLKFATAILMIALTGCLTIEENYTFKKNGSGSMEYVVDMSEMGELMNSIAEMNKTEDGSAMPTDLGTLDMKEELAALKKISGIKGVKLDQKKKWVQRVNFKFKDITALNAALNVLMPDSSGQPHEFFRWEDNTLVRTNNRHAYEVGAGMAKDETSEDPETADGEEGMDMGAFLDAMKYRYSFKFANEVSSTEQVEAMKKETPDRKQLILETDWTVISKDPKALDLRISLDR